MTAALTAWERGQTMPVVPEGWTRPGKPASTGQAGAADTGSPPTSVSTTAAAPLTEDPAIRLNLADDAELLHEFHAESLELLQSIERGVLVLEKNPDDIATIHSIFRAFHTFKGGAGFLHLDALRDLAHDLESLLDAARRSDLRITSGIIDVILAGGDALRHFTREIGAQIEGTRAGEPIVVPTRHLIQRVRAALRGESEPAPTPAKTSESTPTPAHPVLSAPRDRAPGSAPRRLRPRRLYPVQTAPRAS